MPRARYTKTEVDRALRAAREMTPTLDADEAAEMLGISLEGMLSCPLVPRATAGDLPTYTRPDVERLRAFFDAREPNSCDDIFFGDSPDALRGSYYEECIAEIREGRHPLPLPVAPPFKGDEPMFVLREPIDCDVEKAVWARDWRQCRYCGTTKGRMTIDHVRPVSRGGGNSPENLVVCCASCNSSKHNRLPEEWASYSGLKQRWERGR